MAVNQTIVVPVAEADLDHILSHLVTKRTYFALGWIGDKALLTIDEKDFCKLFIGMKSEGAAFKNIVATYKRLKAKASDKKSQTSKH